MKHGPSTQKQRRSEERERVERTQNPAAVVRLSQDVGPPLSEVSRRCLCPPIPSKPTFIDHRKRIKGKSPTNLSVFFGKSDRTSLRSLANPSLACGLLVFMLLSSFSALDFQFWFGYNKTPFLGFLLRHDLRCRWRLPGYPKLETLLETLSETITSFRHRCWFFFLLNI